MRRKILERLMASDVKWVKKYLRKRLLKYLQQKINARAKVATMLSEHGLLDLEFLSKLRDVIITKNIDNFLLLCAEIAFTLRPEETKDALIKATMLARTANYSEVSGILFELFLLFETSDEDDHVAVAQAIMYKVKKLIVAGSPVLIDMLEKYIKDNPEETLHIMLANKLIEILQQSEKIGLDKLFVCALNAAGIMAKGLIKEMAVPVILELTLELKNFIKNEEDLEDSVKAVQYLAKVLEEACRHNFEEYLPEIMESVKEIFALFLKTYLCQEIIPLEVLLSMVVEGYLQDEEDLADYRQLISELIETCEGINKDNLVDSLETIVLTVDALIDLGFKTAVNAVLLPAMRMVYATELIFQEKADQDNFVAVMKKIEKLLLKTEKNGYKKTLKKVVDLVIDNSSLLLKAVLFYYRQEIEEFIKMLSAKESTQSWAIKLKKIMDMLNEDPDRFMEAMKRALHKYGKFN